MANAFEQAALPSAVQILTAVEAFLGNLGTDPVKAVARLPGAFLVLQGQIALQGPALVDAEFGAVMTSAQSSLAAMVAKAKAHEVAAPTAPAA
jgi:hypothetical protein